MNANTLVAILTTSDSDACVRAYNSVPDDYTKVTVVNTPDSDYYFELSGKLPGCNIINTLCTGTPGQGKQSVWDYFLNSDYEYLIPWEGDDVFLPGGVEEIVSWQTRYPSNCWILSGEDIWYDNRGFATWRDMDLDQILTDSGLSGNSLSVMKNYMQQIFELTTHRGYYHQRIVQLDRSVCEQFSYNTQIAGSEDVLLTAQLKLAHLKSQIDVTYCESPEISCYIKNTQSGAGRRFMQSDVSDLRSEFYQYFSKSEIDLLKSTELLNNLIPRTLSDFQRKRQYLKLSRSGP